MDPKLPGLSERWLRPLRAEQHRRATARRDHARLIRKRAGQPLPLVPRFSNADDAMGWYNGWIKTIPPPDDPKFVDPIFNWDPVNKWFDRDEFGLYWYIVGTGDSQSLVIEGEATVIKWGNEYYSYYAAVHGQRAADRIWELRGLPVKRIPADLPPSTPESEFHFPRIASEPPPGEEERPE